MVSIRIHTFYAVVFYRVQCVMKQVGAVKHWYDLHTFRQDAVIEFIHLLVNPIKRGLFLRPF